MIAGLSNGTFNGRVYKGIAQMTMEELGWIAGVTEDGRFVWKDDVETYEDESGFEVPNKIHVHPLTGDLHTRS